MAKRPQTFPRSPVPQEIGIRLLDYLMLLRPTVLMPVWTMTLLGAYQSTISEHSRLWFHIPMPLMNTLLIYSLIMGAVYILNQLADAETDAINNKLYLIAQGYITRRAAWLEALSIGVVGYALAVALVRPISIYHLLLVVSGALGVAYSLPPLRLKGRAGLDLLANAIGYGGIAYMVGWTSCADGSLHMVRMALPYVFCVGAAFVHSTLLDIQGDQQAGDCTTGVFLGARAACAFSFLLITAAVSSSLWGRNTISLTASILSLPLFGYTLFRQTDKTIAVVMRIGVMILTLIIAFLMPSYLVALVFMLFTVRQYYRRRFHVRYPF